jgi:hypothetical protein
MISRHSLGHIPQPTYNLKATTSVTNAYQVHDSDFKSNILSLFYAAADMNGERSSTFRLESEPFSWYHKVELLVQVGKGTATGYSRKGGWIRPVSI